METMNDIVTSCHISLSYTGLEDGNITIPEENKPYFFIRVLVIFTAQRISEDGSMEEVEDDSGEEEQSFFIPQEKLVTEDEHVFRTTIADMVFEFGVPYVNRMIMDPIKETVYELVNDAGNAGKDVLPFFVTIYMEREIGAGNDVDHLDGYVKPENPSEEKWVFEKDVSPGKMIVPRERSTAVEICVICLEEFEDGVQKKKKKKKMGCCENEFHEDCFQTWLAVNHVCPLCRTKIPV